MGDQDPGYPTYQNSQDLSPYNNITLTLRFFKFFIKYIINTYISKEYYINSKFLFNNNL